METNDACHVPHDMERALIEASQLHQHLRTDMPRLKGRAASFCFESASGFYDAFDQGMVRCLHPPGTRGDCFAAISQPLLQTRRCSSRRT